MNSQHVASVTIGIIALSAASIIAETPPAQPAAQTNTAGLSQLSDPRGLNNPTYRWNARAITVADKATAEDEQDNDYATFAFGKPWNFDDGSFSGISAHTNLADFKVADGRLTFTTGKDGYFYWGSHIKGDGFQKLKIGDNWRWPNFVGIWYVNIRLKQSLPESTWKIMAHRDGVITPQGAVAVGSVNVKGTNWQTVSVSMEGNKRLKRYPELRRSLAIQSATPDNCVEIDWVKAVSPVTDAYFRGALTLDKPVKSAALCFTTMGTARYALYINGEKVEAGNDYSSGAAKQINVIDCGRFFREGKNVIAVSERINNWVFALEGIVTFTDGTFKRIYTDGQWKGTNRPVDGWMNPAFDDSAWKPVRADRNSVAMSDMCPNPDNRGAGASGNIGNPPYFGPIAIVSGARSVSGDPQIFKWEDGISLTVEVPAHPGSACTADYTLSDAIDGNKEIASGALSGKEQKDRVVFPFAQKPEKPGVYNFAVTVRSGGQVLDKRLYECAVVGKLPMPEYALDEIDKHVEKKLIDKIECGNPKDPHEMLEGTTHEAKPGQSKTLAKGGVSWREPGKYPNWVSYKFDVKNPWKPHLIEVRYLDDRAARLTIVMADQSRKLYRNIGNVALPRNALTVVTGGPYRPLTGAIHTARLLFWPQYEYSTVTLFSHSMHEPDSPAVVDVSIYELTDVPAVKVPNDSGRLFGDHRERSTLTVASCYAGPDGDLFSYDGCGSKLCDHFGFYRDWYIAIANNIKYLRFSGQNMIIEGFLMYDNNNTFTYSSKVLMGGAQKDQYPLWLEMFGANDLYLIAGFEIFGCLTVQQHREATQYTDEEVANGAPSLCQVNKYGRQAWGGGCGDFAIRPSPCHPQYKQQLREVFSELMGKYGAYKAFVGPGVMSGFFSPTWFYDYKIPDIASALDVDYGDITMQAFEKHLGRAIPVAATGPERYRQRYDWIMQNAKAEFIDFRCKALAELHKVIAAEVEKYPGKKYYLLYGAAAPEEKAYFKGMATRDISRMLGMDPAFYRDDRTMVLGKHMITETMQPIGGLNHEYQFTDEFNQFWGGDNSAAFVRNCFYEFGLGYSKDYRWYWGMIDRILPGSAQFDAHRYFNRYYTARLLKNTPVMVAHLWQDMNLVMGEMDSLRRFGVPYRSIPLGHYQNLAGNGLDRNIVVREANAGGSHAFYVVNPAWWDVDVELKLSRDAEIVDLVNNRNTSGSTLKFKLGAFDIKVFAVKAGSRPSGSEVKLVGAETTTGREGVAFVTERFDKVSKAFAELTPQSFTPLEVNISYDQAKEKMELARRALAEKSYARVMEILDTVAFLRIFNMADELLKKKAEPPRREYRVNCGSNKPYRDSRGRDWLPDQEYKYGSRLYGSDGLNFADQRKARGDFEIKGTADPELYHTERFNTDKYAFRVPDGVYNVTLHFAQTWQPVKTALDVDIDGHRVLTGFDMMAEGGFDTAIVKTFKDIRVTDGELDIRMQGEGNKIMAIEVEPANKGN